MLGTIIYLMAVIVQAASQSLLQWEITFEFVSLGLTMIGNTQFIYIIELVHPSLRGAMWTVIGSFYLIGQIIGCVIPLYTMDLPSSWSWRIPICSAACFQAINLLLYPLIPESPRWLIANGRSEEAHRILVSAFLKQIMVPG